VGEGRLFLLRDCCAVAVEAREDEERDEEVEKRVYLHAAEAVRFPVGSGQELYKNGRINIDR